MEPAMLHILTFICALIIEPCSEASTESQDNDMKMLSETLTSIMKQENMKLTKMMKQVKNRVNALSNEVLGLTKQVQSLVEKVPETKNKPDYITFDYDMPGGKTWWAKKVTRDFYIAGRLSDRMVKYANEDGFGSIISIYNFTDSFHQGGEYFPTTEDTKIVAESLVGIKYGIVVDVDIEELIDIRIVHRLMEMIRDTQLYPRPILIHCGAGYAASFYLLNYLANQTRHDPSFEPRITATNLVKTGANFGFDYTFFPSLMEIVSKTTGTNTSGMVFKKREVPPGREWFKYWHGRHIYKNIFIAGQIWSSHLQSIKDAGYSTIFNFRNGPAENKMKTQEEVTLLNIRDNTGTYVNGGRQSKPRLTETRIDATKPNEYISNTSMVNYESMNTLEFGDSVGYNETKEKLAVEAIGIKYFHKPKVNDIKQALRNSSQLVLFHSRVGHTAKLWALVAASEIWGLPDDWAIMRAVEIGYCLKYGELDLIREQFRT